jgi:membrane dipeptidase
VVTALTLAAGLVLALLLLGAGILPRLLDAAVNRTLLPRGTAAGSAASTLHAGLTVVDLHCDALLWRRDPRLRHRRGHVDLPRLRAGNIAVQVLTVVTRVPLGINIERNDAAAPDLVTALAVTQRWPLPTWRSLRQRALYQAGRLERLARDTGANLVWLRTAADIDTLLARREADRDAVGIVLGLEGAHALEGDMAALDTLFHAGFRLIGPTHFFDNEMGGSAHGTRRGGLTDFGRRVILRMQQLGMVIDLAHASARLAHDVLDLAAGPVLVSHTGVRASCDNQRNIDDLLIQRVAATGGVIGIGLWATALCGRDGAAFARAARHVADVAGVEHVAMGSDWDGAVATLVDAAGAPRITEALLNGGFSADDVRGIMGGNAARVLRRLLPAASGPEAP